jgi:hypothetical protein
MIPHPADLFTHREAADLARLEQAAARYHAERRGLAELSDVGNLSDPSYWLASQAMLCWYVAQAVIEGERTARRWRIGLAGLILLDVAVRLFVP